MKAILQVSNVHTGNTILLTKSECAVYKTSFVYRISICTCICKLIDHSYYLEMRLNTNLIYMDIIYI